MFWGCNVYAERMEVLYRCMWTVQHLIVWFCMLCVQTRGHDRRRTGDCVYNEQLCETFLMFFVCLFVFWDILAHTEMIIES